MAMICFNGDFLSAATPIFGADNRAFRYGDAVFETGRVEDGRWLLQEYHLERMFAGLEVLEIDTANLNEGKLTTSVFELCRLNNCLDSAKLRLQVFRTVSGVAYTIEAETIARGNTSLSLIGYKIDIYPKARKAMDPFSNLKSANYLPYIMADRFAQQNGLDEAIVLNGEGNICDGSKTNVFVMRDNKILTPALHQGCVSGVMRRHVIDQLRTHNYAIEEAALTEEDLLYAEGIFLTNAVRGICWVEWFQVKQFASDRIQPLFNSVFPTK